MPLVVLVWTSECIVDVQVNNEEKQLMAKLARNISAYTRCTIGLMNSSECRISDLSVLDKIVTSHSGVTSREHISPSRRS